MGNKYTHASLDIETLDSATDHPVIPEIAIVVFNPETPGLYDIIEKEVSVAPQIDEFRLAFSEDTVDWWKDIDLAKLNRMVSDDYGQHPIDALKEINALLREFFGARFKLKMWARSPSFDCVKMGGMYREVLGEAYPWGWYHERCTRTLEDFVGISTKRLAAQIECGEIEMFSILQDILKNRPLKAHDALYDAAREADLVVYAVQQGLLKP